MSEGSILLRLFCSLFLPYALKDGSSGVLDMSSTAAIYKPRFYIVGHEATFEKYGVDPQEEALLTSGRLPHDGLAEKEETYGKVKVGATGEEKVIISSKGRWQTLYENVAGVILKGEEPLVKAEQVRRQIAVLEAGVKSARTGQVVECDV